MRASASPSVAAALRWLERVNRRHPWNDDEHFHGWILRNLPMRRRSALDLGCGTGVLVGRLASRFGHVTGIDADEGMARIPALLAPGGCLLVVGLARAATPADVAVDSVSAVLNPLVGLVRHPRRAGTTMPPDAAMMPVRDPTTTIADVTRAARDHLPGGHGSGDACSSVTPCAGTARSEAGRQEP